MKSLKPHIEQLRIRAIEQYRKMDRREIVLVALAMFMISLVLVSQVWGWVSSAYETQAAELEQTEKEVQEVSALLQRYLRLQQRRTAIEASYQQIEIKEGGLSLLERLIRTEAGISSGFVIKDNPPRQFGGNYEQAPFNVKFPTSDMSKLIDFLDKLIHGPQPMVLTRLDLRKNRGSDRIDVELDVSSFRKVR